MNFGKNAISGDKIRVIPSPIGRKTPGDNCFSSGPTFDLTPKDDSTQCCMDTINSPYGPPYGVEGHKK